MTRQRKNLAKSSGKSPVKSIVLVGMMGSGKSFIGEALAQTIGLPFRDSDTLIAEDVGVPVPEIFKYQGEDYFRRKERQIIKRILTAEACVLSTGGGAFCQSEIRQSCRKHGFSIYLDVPVKTLWRRIGDKKTRPLAQGGYKAFAALLKNRTADYASADAVIDCKGKSKKRIVADILSLLPEGLILPSKSVI